MKTSYCRVPRPFSFCRHPAKLKGGCLLRIRGKLSLMGDLIRLWVFRWGVFSISKVGDFDVQLHGFPCRNTRFDTSRTHQHLGLMSTVTFGLKVAIPLRV